MSGSGYNDPKKLADAKALATMFSKPNPRGRNGGGSRNYGGEFDNRGPREKYNYSPPPPPRMVISNIPPPSRRNYTDTLVSDNLRRPAGNILGSSPMDFLNRREPTPQPISANLPQDPPSRNTLATIPPSMTSTPARNAVQGQNGTDVSGNENHVIAPARADVDHTGDVRAEASTASGTENGQPRAELPVSAASRQTPTAPGSCQGNNIASTWASSYNDTSDEDEEEGEITEAPMTEPPREQGALKLPRGDDEDLIMISPNHKPSTLDSEDGSKPLSVPTGVPTGATNGSSVQKMRESINPTFQENGREPDQVSPAIKPPSQELPTPRDETRGQIKPGEPTNTSNLRPQAPGFVPDPQAISLGSPMSPPVFPSSAPAANPSTTERHAESREGTPSHQSYVHYPVGKDVDSSPSFTGHLITITPVRIADGFLVPGPTNGHVLMQPHLDTPNHPQASLMQVPAMPMTPGPSQPNQAGENKAAAPVQKPKAPRKTQGLKSSMWAS